MERLTPDYLESQIARTVYVRPEGCGTLTLCVLTMKNGLHIVGESACLNPNDFDQALGEKYARENAFSKLWQLEGYARAHMKAEQQGFVYQFAETTEALKQLCESLTNLPKGGWICTPAEVKVEFHPRTLSGEQIQKALSDDTAFERRVAAALANGRRRTTGAA